MNGPGTGGPRMTRRLHDQNGTVDTAAEYTPDNEDGKETA